MSLKSYVNIWIEACYREKPEGSGPFLKCFKEKNCHPQILYVVNIYPGLSPSPPSPHTMHMLLL